MANATGPVNAAAVHASLTRERTTDWIETTQDMFGFLFIGLAMWLVLWLTPNDTFEPRTISQLEIAEVQR